MAVKKGGLGKGLDALFQDNAIESESGVVTLSLSEIQPNKDQPRKNFDEAALLELSESIKEHGVLQPLIVRPLLSGQYQLVAGERRYRASMLAEISSVPVIIKDLTDREVMEIALIENLQRKDLDPIEEAEGYKALSEQFNLTQNEIAERVKKSRPAVANAMRLTTLPEQVKKMVSQNEISMGHARALLPLEKEEDIISVAQKVKSQNLSVRQTEALIASLLKEPKEKKIKRVDSFYKELEIALENTWGRKIKITPSGKDSGSFTVQYLSREDLIELTEKLTGAKIDATEID